jgi:hypothetical protein
VDGCKKTATVFLQIAVAFSRAENPVCKRHTKGRIRTGWYQSNMVLGRTVGKPDAEFKAARPEIGPFALHELIGRTELRLHIYI